MMFSYLSFLLLLSPAVLAGSRDSNHRPIGGLQAISITNQDPSAKLKERRSNNLEGRQTCHGDCASCFGTGYTLCPGALITCYKPGDPDYGIDSCPYTSSTPSAAAVSTPSSTTSATGSSYTLPSFCSNGGSSCSACFGAGYVQCSSGSSHCHNPSDPDSVCPNDSSGSGSSSAPAPSSTSGAGSGSDCSSAYGSDYIQCGTLDCYNPSLGETCCSDGKHCFSGETCSATPGKCDFDDGDSDDDDSNGSSGSSSSSSASAGTYSPTRTSSQSATSQTYFGSANTGSSSSSSNSGSQSSANGHVVNVNGAAVQSVPILQLVLSAAAALSAAGIFLWTDGWS